LDAPPPPLPGSLPTNGRPEPGSPSGSAKPRWPFGIAVIAMQIKARRSGLALSGPGRMFALSFLPCIAVAGLLTVAFVRLAFYHLLPSVWLLFYAVAAISGGAFSIPLLPLTGPGFMFARAFGGLHIVFGISIASQRETFGCSGSPLKRRRRCIFRFQCGLPFSPLHVLT
jgi:hypothetical protein